MSELRIVLESLKEQGYDTIQSLKESAIDGRKLGSWSDRIFNIISSDFIMIDEWLDDWLVNWLNKNNINPELKLSILKALNDQGYYFTYNLRSDLPIPMTLHQYGIPFRMAAEIFMKLKK